MRYGILLAFILFLPCLGMARAQGISDDPLAKETGMKIILRAGDKTATATMEDSRAARDFMALLPMQLTLTDYAGTEKVSALPKKLSTVGAAGGFDPDVGDITYYAPWGNFALFYRDFGYASGLVPLGRLDSGIELFRGDGPITVTIDRIE